MLCGLAVMGDCGVLLQSRVLRDDVRERVTELGDVGHHVCMPNP